MDNEIKLKCSPMLLLMRGILLVCILGFLTCSFFAFADLRSEEEKELEYKTQLIEHPLFSDAKEFAKEMIWHNKYNGFYAEEENTTRISCLKVRLSGSITKVVLIETSNGESYCFMSSKSRPYAITPYTSMYRQLKREGLVLSELILEGDDLNIVFEEAQKG